VGIAGRNNDSTNRDDEAGDDLPSIEEILGLISHRGISTGGDRNAKAALQDLDKPALDTSGSRISPICYHMSKSSDICAALNRLNSLKILRITNCDEIYIQRRRALKMGGLNWRYKRAKVGS
jgi:hypothetical protein